MIVRDTYYDAITIHSLIGSRNSGKPTKKIHTYIIHVIATVYLFNNFFFNIHGTFVTLIFNCVERSRNCMDLDSLRFVIGFSNSSYSLNHANQMKNLNQSCKIAFSRVDLRRAIISFFFFFVIIPLFRLVAVVDCFVFFDTMWKTVYDMLRYSFELHLFGDR